MRPPPLYTTCWPTWHSRYLQRRVFLFIHSLVKVHADKDQLHKGRTLNSHSHNATTIKEDAQLAHTHTHLCHQQHCKRQLPQQQQQTHRHQPHPYQRTDTDARTNKLPSFAHIMLCPRQPCAVGIGLWVHLMNYELWITVHVYIWITILWYIYIYLLYYELLYYEFTSKNLCHVPLNTDYT